MYPRSTLLICVVIATQLGSYLHAQPTSQPDPLAPQWRSVELEFRSSTPFKNAYLECEAWVDFEHEDGTKLRRPMFWDGDNTFRVRFASTKPQGTWTWTSKSNPEVEGLSDRSGRLQAAPNPSKLLGAGGTVFDQHGFWSIPTGERNLLHADGTSRFMCADTPWALPWRSTVEQCERYAIDRQSKGFNAALLMTVMPDSNTTGPRSRSQDTGFAVGFEDLPLGELKQLNVDYFQYFDRLVDILVRHGIAPVYQPVFHGYGWKGGGTAGNRVSAEDYARYCRYLVARYGSMPAIWLVGGDGPVTNEKILHQLDAAGSEIQRWDAYDQPTGIHYSPHALNRSHQDKPWLDFQWCQTGHSGEHVPERVADMWRNEPIKAIANGEPTYENIGKTGVASGWWQGHEAWCNVTAGGTMGVVYGAASLWNWKLRADEPGHADWCTAPGAGWDDALQFEGSRYPGIAAKILNQYEIRGMQPNWTCTYGRRGLLIPNQLFVLYLSAGGSAPIVSELVPRHYRIYDPQTGEILREGELEDTKNARVDSGVDDQPVLMVFHQPL